ncbi:DMT family transporter [Reinekea marinisedimentorum]|uniref:DME family drug/metabolite transporter n=1 Tax=Reinekea marinisedimentorum TaxID=230495 RepID=A0A4R3I1X5_9GAMM|nr:EamA family transporter [Reinekea marinisedimentorum]TCS39766.1 DME family drug/metabolite transporter [Reinekea marinisedimentorum]
MKNSEFYGAMSIVLASIIWGSTGTAASFAPNVSPLAIGAFAMGVGGVLLMLTSLQALKHDRARLMLEFKTLLLGGLSVAIYPLAFYSSMRAAGVAVGTVISLASAPLFSVLLERLINKKRISGLWLFSFLLGGSGIVLLTLGKQHQSSGIHIWGVVLGLVAALTYAGYSWSAKQMIDRGIDSKSAMASMFGLAAVFLLPSLFFTSEHMFSSLNNVMVALYMATIPMFLGYLLFGYGLVYVAASKATLITLLEPTVATLLAIAIVGEQFSAVGWLGMVLIAACSLLQVIRRPGANRLAVPEHSN